MGIHTSLSARISGNSFLRYLVAVISALAASLVCSGLHRFVGNGGCYVLLLLAVAFSSWYCGVGPSVAVVFVGISGSTFGFIPRTHAFAVPGNAEWIGMAMFLLSSALVVLMGEARRRQNKVLIEEQSALEQKVAERTADLDTLNHNLRELSARLMQLQDDERRRIARELHDSVGQTLAALAMNLSLVRTDVERLARTAATLNDSESLVREMSTEVRTISHLLHPPLLDEAGLSSAIRWYVDGFAQRSRIKVELDLPEDLKRLPGEMETAIFRVVQECLTNIHRHSGSSVAKIRLRQRNDQVLVAIEDRGRGIPLTKQEEMASTGTPGVGIRGMRERLRQLGGSLDMKSGIHGTTVTVQLPVGEKSVAKAVPVAGPAAA
jgi:signal transduction histidine kinase